MILKKYWGQGGPGPPRYKSGCRGALQVAKMLVVIVVLFLLLWTPRMIFSILIYTSAVSDNSNTELNLTLVRTISYLNSCVNVFVYAITAK